MHQDPAVPGVCVATGEVRILRTAMGVITGRMGLNLLSSECRARANAVRFHIKHPMFLNGGRTVTLR